MAEGADACGEDFGGDDEGCGVGAEVEGELGGKRGALMVGRVVGFRDWGSELT